VSGRHVKGEGTPEREVKASDENDVEAEQVEQWWKFVGSMLEASDKSKVYGSSSRFVS
jgi:hypothetical protein